MPNNIKVTAQTWIKTARKALIEKGLAGVKIDRLAKTLGVTRGGFYHNFKSHDDLMARLLEDWSTSNEFLPTQMSLKTPFDALVALEAMLDRVIVEKEFSPALEMAVREWARIDPKAKRIVDRVDDERIDQLTGLFAALGYDADEAPIRARVFYYHQIGFYALGHHKHQTKAYRLKNAPIYLRIIGGPLYLEAEKRFVRAPR